MSASKKTVPKQLTPWKPGQSGNPAGRPKGSRSKLGEEFIADVYEKWLCKGDQILDDVIKDRPHEFLKVVASLMPKELNVSTTRELTDEQLDQRIRQLAVVFDVEGRISESLGGKKTSSTAH